MSVIHISRPMSFVGRPPGNMPLPRSTGGMIITSAVQHHNSAPQNNQSHGNSHHGNPSNSAGIWEKLPVKTAPIPRSMTSRGSLPQVSIKA